MPGKTIPDLDPAPTVAMTDQVPVSQSGLTKRITLAQLRGTQPPAANAATLNTSPQLGEIQYQSDVGQLWVCTSISPIVRVAVGPRKSLAKTAAWSPVVGAWKFACPELIATSTMVRAQFLAFDWSANGAITIDFAGYWAGTYWLNGKAVIRGGGPYSTIKAGSDIAGNPFIQVGAVTDALSYPLISLNEVIAHNPSSMIALLSWTVASVSSETGNTYQSVTLATTS